MWLPSSPTCPPTSRAGPSWALLSSQTPGADPVSRCCLHSLLPVSCSPRKTLSYGAGACPQLCVPLVCRTAPSICSLPRLRLSYQGHFPRHLDRAVGAARWRILLRRKSAQPPGCRWSVFAGASRCLPSTFPVVWDFLVPPLLSSLLFIKPGVAAHGRPPQPVVLSSFVLGLPNCSSQLWRWFAAFQPALNQSFSSHNLFQVPAYKARLHLYLFSSLLPFLSSDNQPGFCSPFTLQFSPKCPNADSHQPEDLTMSEQRPITEKNAVAVQQQVQAHTDQRERRSHHGPMFTTRQAPCEAHSHPVSHITNLGGRHCLLPYFTGELGEVWCLAKVTQLTQGTAGSPVEVLGCRVLPLPSRSHACPLLMEGGLGAPPGPQRPLLKCTQPGAAPTCPTTLGA